MNRSASVLTFLIALFIGSLASAEGLVFAPEVPCDFEVEESYFLLMYDSGRLSVIPALTAPVRGRGDKALVGGATWIVGGILPEDTGESTQSEKLTMVRAVLRGAGELVKIVPVALPVAEDLHSLDDATREIAALLKTRAQELERAEGKIVQAQAELERMRAGSEDPPMRNQPSLGEGTSTQRIPGIAQSRRAIESLEARYEKVKLNAQYPFDNLVQSTYEQAADRFRNEVTALTKRNRTKSDSAALSPEERQRLIELGRSVDPTALQERLALIRSKTRSFEEKLRNLGADTERYPQDVSPAVRHHDIESSLPTEEE